MFNSTTEPRTECRQCCSKELQKHVKQNKKAILYKMAF